MSPHFNPLHWICGSYSLAEVKSPVKCKGLKKMCSLVYLSKGILIYFYGKYKKHIKHCFFLKCFNIYSTQLKICLCYTAESKYQMNSNLVNSNYSNRCNFIISFSNCVYFTYFLYLIVLLAFIIS